MYDEVDYQRDDDDKRKNRLFGIEYDGDGHLVFYYKEKFFCIKCDLWYILKHIKCNCSGCR